MEEQELINIWKAYDKKIEEARVLNLQSWALNLQSFGMIQTQKAKSKMDSLIRFKGRAVFIGLIYVLLLAVLIYGNHFANMYFTISLIMILLITVYAILVYIKHIILIKQLKYDESITDTQKKLSILQTSTIYSTRIAWLQMPFYCTWFWNTQWILHDITFWLIAFPITMAFTILTVWLYRNISYRNVNKKWFKILFNTPEWKSVRKATEFMCEIEDYIS
jgi:hypothetical protein